MTRKLYIGLSVFFGMWLGAHLFYAFATLTWVPFTKWEPFSRGLMLGLTLYLSVGAAWCTSDREQ